MWNSPIWSHPAWNSIQSCFQNLSPEKLWELFAYQPEAPLMFGTGLFLFLFLFFYIIYNSLKNRFAIRIIYVVLFSLYFYYKTSGFWFILLIFTATSDFLIGRIIARTPTHTPKCRKKRKWLLILSISVNLTMLASFKYTNFIYELIVYIWHIMGAIMNEPVLTNITYTPLNLFIPIGISFFTFQSLSYTIDLYRKKIKPVRRWIDYLFFVSFFPGLVAGPIVRANDFVPQIYQKPIVLHKHLGEALFLIICGLMKKCVLSDYIGVNFVDRIFDAPTLYTGVENLLGVYGYALQIYCDFSGYSDMAIGIALLLGFRFNINFNSPYKATSVTEFWRRWHISLSTWLRDYLYIPLGGNRKGKINMYANLLITMIIGGLWHGAAFRFILWGAIHGVALIGHKLFAGQTDGQHIKKPLWKRFIGFLFTFHIVCFAWIFFRADSMSKINEILTQIFTHFEPKIFLQFIIGYPTLTIFMTIGYITHFMPSKIDMTVRRKVINSPLCVKTILLCISIFIIAQIKNADIVPFIYFQF